MPFVPHIRKQIAQALDSHILPALSGGAVLQVLAEAPYQFPHIQTHAVKAPLLSDRLPGRLQPSWHWQKEHMSAGRSPYLIIVFQGAIEHTIGVTHQMAEEAQTRGNNLLQGRLKLLLPAPACLYIPPFTPGHDGTKPFHIGEKPAGILCFNLWDQEILAHVAISSGNEVECSHSLVFKDSAMVQMARLYEEELKAGPGNANAAAQAQLYVFCSRMRRLLQTTSIPLSNTAHAAKVREHVDEKSKKGQLCLQAMQYIELHLCDALSREALAAELGVSPSHLNYVFCEAAGISLMRYVTSRRIEAAKNILQDSDEPLKDISQLTGFAGSASFCGAFKRATGLAPNEYRRKSRSSHKKFSQ